MTDISQDTAPRVLEPWDFTLGIPPAQWGNAVGMALVIGIVFRSIDGLVGLVAGLVSLAGLLIFLYAIHKHHPLALKVWARANASGYSATNLTWQRIEWY